MYGKLKKIREEYESVVGKMGGLNCGVVKNIHNGVDLSG